MSSRTVVVDDTDTDAIAYYFQGSPQPAPQRPVEGQGWSAFTDPAGDDDIHNSTLHAALSSGTSLQFAFNGTRVAVFGSVWPPTELTTSLAASSYTVLPTGSSANVSTGTFSTPNFTIEKNNLNFFTSDELPYGSYTLNVNVTFATADSSFLFDYIVFQAPDPPPTPSSSNSVTPTQTSQTPTSPSSAPYNSHYFSKSAIAGLVVGTLMILAFVGVMSVLVYLRRRRERPARPSPEYEYKFAGEQMAEPPALMEPFILPEPGHLIREAGDDDASLQLLPAAVHHPYATPPQSPEPMAGYSSDSPPSAHRGEYTRGYLRRAHSDSGTPIHALLPSEEDEAPPAYTPAPRR